MKKALTIATLLGLAGAAQAQVSLYGLIDMSYGKNNIGVSATEKEDFHSGGDNGSSQGNSTTRVGVKGSTDVGSGVKANFKLETGGINAAVDKTIERGYAKLKIHADLICNGEVAATFTGTYCIKTKPA